MDDLISRHAVRLIESDSDAYPQEWNDDYENGFTDALNKVLALPSVPPEITDEQAILHLQASGWMQRHDKEMYESGLRERLADDSLIPCDDTVSRQAAIDHWRLIIDATNTDSRYNMGFVDGLEFCISHLSTMPSAQPEIIRCKDCKWKNNHNCTRAVEVWIDDDKFCAWAERRTDG